MKAYLVSGFSIDFGNAEWGSAPIESQVFATLAEAHMYVEECAELTTTIIKAELGESIYYQDKVENVYNAIIKHKRTIDVRIDIDNASNKMFFKRHNLAQNHFEAFDYRQMDLSDSKITLFKVLDMRITEIEL